MNKHESASDSSHASVERSFIRYLTLARTEIAVTTVPASEQALICALKACFDCENVKECALKILTQADEYKVGGSFYANIERGDERFSLEVIAFNSKPIKRLLNLADEYIPALPSLKPFPRVFLNSAYASIELLAKAAALTANPKIKSHGPVTAFAHKAKQPYAALLSKLENMRPAFRYAEGSEISETDTSAILEGILLYRREFRLPNRHIVYARNPAI